MKTWNELLEVPTDGLEPEELGANTPQIAALAWTLQHTDWFAHIGEEIPSETTSGVASWEEIYVIWDLENTEFTAAGHVQAPADLCADFIRRNPRLNEWWQLARKYLSRTIGTPASPDQMPQEQSEMLFEYLWEFYSMVLAEIIASPDVDCTYFREQLAWFHAGHFPCGWDGEWPVGKMRVF